VSRAFDLYGFTGTAMAGPILEFHLTMLLQLDLHCAARGSASARQPADAPAARKLAACPAHGRFPL
jgi:hypothetical protein